jgi:LacI family transcriptional regulator
VIAVNDAMAIGVLHRFRGLPPERRPAVTGFDDIAWAQLTEPPLTTVAVDAIQIGVGAAELLMARIATPDRDTLPVREIRVPATMRLRRSCGCSDPSGPTPAAAGDR